MGLTKLNNVEYANALKEALIMRRNGTIPPQIDNQLGIMSYNIANWAICEALKDKTLFPEHVDGSPDFRSEITAKVCLYLDRVNLDREPKEILVYLKRVASSSIRDFIKRINRAKRKHEDVPLEDADLEADFYGRCTGQQIMDFKN